MADGIKNSLKSELSELNRPAEYGHVYSGGVSLAANIPTVMHDSGYELDVSLIAGVHYRDAIYSAGGFYKYEAITHTSGTEVDFNNSMHAFGFRIGRVATELGSPILDMNSFSGSNTQLGIGRMGFGDLDGNEVAKEWGVYLSNQSIIGGASIPMSGRAFFVPSLSFESDFFYPFDKSEIEDLSGSFQHMAIMLNLDLMYADDTQSVEAIFTAFDTWEYYLSLLTSHASRLMTYDIYGEPTLPFGSSGEPSQLTEEQGVLLALSRAMADLGKPAYFYFRANSNDPVAAQIAKYEPLISALVYGIWGATNLGDDKTKSAANYLLAPAFNDLNSFAAILVEEYLNSGAVEKVAIRMLIASLLQVAASAGGVDGGAGVVGVAMSPDPKKTKLVESHTTTYSPCAYYADTEGRSGLLGVVRHRNNFADSIFGTELVLKSPALGAEGVSARGQNLAGEDGVEYPLGIPSSVMGALSVETTLLGDENGVHLNGGLMAGLGVVTDNEGGSILGVNASLELYMPLFKGYSLVFAGNAGADVNIPHGIGSAELDASLGIVW